MRRDGVWINTCGCGLLIMPKGGFDITTFIDWFHQEKKG